MIGMPIVLNITFEQSLHKQSFKANLPYLSKQLQNKPVIYTGIHAIAHRVSLDEYFKFFQKIQNFACK